MEKIKKMNWFAKQHMASLLEQSMDNSGRFSYEEKSAFVASLTYAEWKSSLGVNVLFGFTEKERSVMLRPEKTKLMRKILLDETHWTRCHSENAEMSRWASLILDRGDINNLMVLFECDPKGNYLTSSAFQELFSRSRWMQASEAAWIELVEKYPAEKDEGRFLTKLLAQSCITLRYDNAMVALIEHVAASKNPSLNDAIADEIRRNKWDKDAEIGYKLLPFKVGVFRRWWTFYRADIETVLEEIAEAQCLYDADVDVLLDRNDPTIAMAVVEHCNTHNRTLKGSFESRLQAFPEAFEGYYSYHTLKEESLLHLIKSGDKKTVLAYLQSELEEHRNDDKPGWFNSEIEEALWKLNDPEIADFYARNAHLPYAEERKLILNMTRDAKSKTQAKVYVSRYPLHPLNEVIYLRLTDEVEDYLKTMILTDVGEIELVTRGKAEHVALYAQQLLADHKQWCTEAEKRYLQKADKVAVRAYIAAYKKQLPDTSQLSVLMRGDQELAAAILDDLHYGVLKTFVETADASTIATLLPVIKKESTIQGVLLKRKDEALLWAFVNQARFEYSYEEEFIETCEDESLIETYLAFGPLESKSLLALLKRNSLTLTQAYISRYPLEGEALRRYGTQM
jgi:hypothetical protein